MKRRRKRLVGKTDLFKKDKNKNSRRQGPTKRCPTTKRKREEEGSVTEAIMLIPHTPGGQLKKELKNVEEALKFKGWIRYSEDLGSKVSDLLVKQTP